MDGTRTIFTLLAVAAVITGTVGCDPDEGQWVGPHRATDPGPKTAVVADSLVDDNDPLWQGSRLAHEGPIAINSLGQTRYHDHRQWIRTLRPVPDRVIVALGTNNAWDVPPLDGWHVDDQRSFTNLVALIRSRGVDCIVVTTIGVHPGARASFHDHALRANGFLRAFVSDDPAGDLRLADWATISRDHTGYFTDEVHHTRAGAHAYHVTLADAARSCPP